MVKVTDTPLPKRLEGAGWRFRYALSRMDEAPPAKKMEPKCIAIIQAMELGNPLVLLSQVG